MRDPNYVTSTLAGGLALICMLACSGTSTVPGADSPPDGTHHAQVAGAVSNAAGQPLEGIEVMVQSASRTGSEDTTPFGIAHRSSVTNGAGRFVIDVQLMPGDPARTLDSVFVIKVQAYALDPRFPRQTNNIPYSDSAKVTVQVVPRDRPAREFDIGRIVLPVP